MARKPTDYVQFKLRVREGLRRKIERAADLRKHSANAEAVWRIERTFTQDEEIAAQAEAMEVREAELQEMARQHWDEQAKRDAEHEAAIRDSRVLNTLVGGDWNAQLLRLMILGMGNNPEWAATPESRKIFADKVHQFLISADINKGATNEGPHT